MLALVIAAETRLTMVLLSRSAPVMCRQPGPGDPTMQWEESEYQDACEGEGVACAKGCVCA